MQVVLACTGLEQPAPDRLAALLWDDLDWEALRGAAVHHNVLPLVYHRLKDLPDDLFPAREKTRMREIVLTQALRGEWLVEGLLAILGCFEGKGIEAVPIKGPVLAAQAYGDVDLRAFYDLDILIHPGDFRSAYELLAEAGYQPAFVVKPGQDKLLLRGDYDLSFRGDGVPVELHWSVAEPSVIHPLEVVWFWDGLDTVSLPGGQVRALSVERTLLMICIHGAKHQWNKLKWIVDLAHLVGANPGLDWEALFEQAERAGFRRVLHLGVYLAKAIGGASLPAAWEDRIPTDPRVEELASQVVEDFLLARENPGMVSSARFYLRTRERTRDRLYYLYDQALVPKQADWRGIKLPIWLYPLLRPWRLLFKFVEMLVRNLTR